MPNQDTPIIITLCGGGNCAHVGAGVLGHRTDQCRVNVLTRSPENWGQVITITEPDGTKYGGRIEKVTSDPAAVIPKSDIVLLCSPVAAHIPLLQEIAPHLRPKTLVGSMMSQGGLDWMIEKYAGNCDAIACGLKEVPWVSRTKERGRAALKLGAKDCLWIAVNPSSDREYAQQMMARCFGQRVELLPSFLCCTLTPGNQVIHPARYYGIFHEWDGVTPYTAEQIPLLYRDMDAFSADMLTKLSDELLAIRDALTVSYPSLDLSRVQTIDASIIDGYGDQVVDASSMLTVFRTNSAYAKIATPVKEVNGGFVPDPTTRLFTDDVPFGLCILKDLGLRLKVETPGIDIVLVWMQNLMGKEYLVNGELRGKHMNECGILGNYGFLNDVDDVIAFAT